MTNISRIRDAFASDAAAFATRLEKAASNAPEGAIAATARNAFAEFKTALNPGLSALQRLSEANANANSAITALERIAAIQGGAIRRMTEGKK